MTHPDYTDRASHQPHQPRQPESRSILLVEGGDRCADHTYVALKDAGYRVFPIEGAYQAKEHLRERIRIGLRLPDLILLGDLAIEEDVLQLLGYLDDLGDEGPPVMLCTSLSELQIEDLPRRIRAVGFAVDPLDQEKLLRSVGHVMKAVEKSDRSSQEGLSDKEANLE